MSQTLAGKRILLVDDDPDILASLQAAFEPTGAEVDSSANGNDAVAKAESMTPDLIVLDMMLPGRSGFLVLEKLRKRKPSDKPYVIMITGNQGARHRSFADTYGVNEYFNKPVRMEKVVQSAEKLLASP